MQVNIKLAKILIVDDQPENVMVIDHMLRAEGYTKIISTTDSRTVEGLYRLHQFDIILLDLNMPFLNGFEVMEKLKEVETETYLPILVITADTDYQTRQRALASGAKDFLSQPIDRLELLVRIGNMLEVRLAHQMVRNEKAILEERVQERTQELNDTRLEIIRRLGRAAEYRDNETGLHIIRMSKYCELLAREIGLPEAQCKILLDATPMHDIGKIGIPDAVLLKPGKLTPEEFGIIKTHTTIGSRILSGHNSDLMETAREIAHTHHEKWDGSGYPQGLKGEEIPISGRIAALCDVFDALTMARPYKKAWTLEAAVDYINENNEKHFDPKLVAAFNRTLPKTLEIQKALAEPVAEFNDDIR